MSDSEPETKIIWLIGEMSKDITVFNKLPTKRQVLSRLFYLHINEKKIISDSIKTTITEVIQVWDRTTIPITQDYNIKRKMLNLYSTWEKLRKNKNRQSEAQKNSQQLFTNTLDDLFDVAHANALTLIKHNEVANFLYLQRQNTGRIDLLEKALAENDMRNHKGADIKDPKNSNDSGIIITEDSEDNNVSCNVKICNSENLETIWLVGKMSKDIAHFRKLPTKREVLGRFFYSHVKEKRSIDESLSITVTELMRLWQSTRIPIMQEYNIKKKVEKLYLTWYELQKSRCRRTKTQEDYENVFTVTIDNLFDVSHANASTLIECEEIQNFLQLQRKNKGTIDELMKILADKEAENVKSLKAKETSKKKRNRPVSIQLGPESICNDLLNSDSEYDSDSTTRKKLKLEIISELSDPSFHPPNLSKNLKSNSKIQLSPLQKLLTPQVCSALDRTSTSHRSSVHILASVSQALGHDPQKIVCSAESIRLARIQNRKMKAKEIREAFNPTVPLTVHWDGKMLPALTSKESVDRLAVLVSGEDVIKLLGVPIIPAGTGKAQANAVHQLLKEWNLAEQVTSTCFDTTASNTGLYSGAITELEKILKKFLLSLACRHHIMELPVAAVFLVLFGPSNGPNIELFQRFKKSWKHIDSNKYETGLQDVTLASSLTSFKKEMITFIHQQLQVFHPRDDYKELLELALVFLGETSHKGSAIHIHAPGAYHRARWMAKIIYSLKIYIFRGQFSLKKEEIAGLRQFNLFVIKVYLQKWFTCQTPAVASRNDLVFLKELVTYAEVNIEVAEAAYKSFSGHLWYLSETLVALAFFDPEVTTQTKRLMVSALSKKSSEVIVRRIEVNKRSIMKKTLPDFVTTNTSKFFTCLKIPQDFLLKDPSSWKDDASFNLSQKRVNQLKVVNDTAERGIALITQYNSSLTHQEDQKQFLLQLIEEHRRKYKNANKSTIVQGLKQD